jgi:hypothetical protein
VRFVGIGGGLSVKGVEEGFALWSVCRFIRRSALLGMVHKIGLGMGNGEFGVVFFSERECSSCMSKNKSMKNIA